MLELTLEEECSLVGDQVTGEVLRCVHQASDDCPAEIGALEEIEEGWGSALLGLDLDSTFNHGERLLRLLGVFATQSLDGAESFRFAAAAEQPPGGFGGQEDQNQEGSLDGSVDGILNMRIVNSRGRAIAAQEAHAKPTRLVDCCMRKWHRQR